VGQELEDEPAGRGRLEGRAGEEVGQPIAHAADLAFDDALDGGAKQAQSGGLGPFPQAPLEDLRDDLAHREVVGGGDVAQAAEDVPADPGGDLGFRGYGCRDLISAWENLALSARE
jgi:hypothetical protein